MTGRESKLREILHQQVADEVFTPSADIPPTKEETFEFSLAANEKHTDYAKLDLFHRAVYPIMLLAQCFAIMPLTGVWEANPKRIRFAFKSIQMMFTIIFMVFSSILTLGTLKHLLKIGVNAKNFVGLVFFACVQSACIIFIDLARHWPPVIRYWTRTEMVFTRPPYEIPKTNLASRIRLAALIIIAMSIGEHALYLTSAIISYTKRRHICALTDNRTSSVVTFDAYMEENYSYVFQIVPYSPFIAVYVLLINGICTFIWNYMDLFIMMISKGLAYRFEQISTRIRKLESEQMIPESTFIEIREHYVKMCEILERVDNVMSSLILLSCVNNLYFVCYQLLNVFNKLRWPINYVYFWYSLLYLIGRCAFVFLTAAAINDESKSALGILRRVSTRSWCVEVERLIFQMTTQTVALSGKKFYFLTRRLLFGMAGTIVTYELVLLQFDEPNRRKGLLPLCA
ncbi:uncharacterized protein Dwil_GK17552 [Drosophila willistoni]|uniref:Gustatory receptor n=1 Tax=Drosophila willistoni TaxID=7260 RepID=B4MMP5_DROWI|nr:uncharacterized protein Dwil_GK17552 [Drosophila willistoni]